MLPTARLSLNVILRILGVFVFLGFFVIPSVRGQIIYDNTTTYLGNFVTEKREYGDQLDLGGSARRLKQINFEYYGRFATNGDEAVKVRLYTNEEPYDRYRKSPTTLIFESAWMPITPGYRSRSVGGLDVLLPLHTVTFTVEFRGIGEDEEAGLLLYDPPTVGYSFNEFWRRGSTGIWVPVVYSLTDPKRRASASLRLVAVPEIVVDQQQALASSTIGLRGGTNRVRLAQTFTANESGLLSDIVLNMNFSGAPVRLRLLDTINGRPGPKVLAARNITAGGGTNQVFSMETFDVSLKKGERYAIELSTEAVLSPLPSYLLAVGTHNYSRGALWFRNEAGGYWTQIFNPETGYHDLDAAFEVRVVAAEPSAEIVAPRPLELFDVGEPIHIRARHKTPEIGTITRMRFLLGSQEIGVVTNEPYEFVWTNAPSGEHQLRAIAEDSFRRPFRSDAITVHVRAAGAPENDFFAQRIGLDGLNLRRIKPSANATTEAGEPGLRSEDSATLWWEWTAYDDSPVTISAQNSSSPGAGVAVFRGEELEQLTLITNGTPLVRFQPDPGVSYAISVDPGQRGDSIVLDIATADVQIEDVSATLVRVGQPISVWLSESNLRKITNVSLLAGSEIFGSSGWPTNRITSEINTNGFFDLVARAVDDRGIETVSRAVRITVQPGNNAFADRTRLLGDYFDFDFSPAASSLEAGEPFLPNLGFAQRGSSWWTWTAPSSGPAWLQVNSHSSAAAIAVFTGNTFGDLVLLKQNAGTGRVAFNAEAGQTYHFRVVGNLLDPAPITLNLSRLRFIAAAAADGAVTLSFDALDEAVWVEYSSDLLHWKRAEGMVLPGERPVTWTDSGPPVTETNPGEEGARFYRLVVE